jgi:hypothetical protein
MVYLSINPRGQRIFEPRREWRAAPGFCPLEVTIRPGGEAHAAAPANIGEGQGDRTFREGIAVLGRLALSFDAWM